MKNITIYALRDPRDWSIFYIGKTINPRKRLNFHVSGEVDSAKYRLIRDIRSSGKDPIMETLQICPPWDWERIERKWIKEYRDAGMPLVNISIGGGARFPGVRPSHTERTKNVLRERNRIQFSDPELKQRHQEATEVWWSSLTDEQKVEIIEQGKRELAKARTPEHQSKASRAHWDNLTPEERQKFVNDRAEKCRLAQASPEYKAKRALIDSTIWSRTKVRKARLDGINKAWADPEKRAARIAKIRETRLRNGTSKLP